MVVSAAVIWCGLLCWGCNPWVVRPYSWTGVVTDGSTGKPIEGATVSVIWTTKGLVQMDGGRGFLGASETTTDHEGRFQLAGLSGFAVNPFKVLAGAPYTYIAKPGYSIGDGIQSTFTPTTRSWTFRPQIPLTPCTSVDTIPMDDSFFYIGFCGLVEHYECIPRNAVPLLIKAKSDRSGALCWKK